MSHPKFLNRLLLTFENKESELSGHMFASGGAKHMETL
jgi:hypothetical protein